MTNTNDQRILMLKKHIEDKKEKLGRIARFSPTTSLIIDFEGAKLNLNVLVKEQLIVLLVKLHALLNSAEVLGYKDKVVISGFSLEDWISDIKGKLDFLSKKDEEKALKLAEAKLTELLSEDKKIELELDAIASFLKD